MILADENVHYSLIRELRNLSVDVLPVVDSSFRGISDGGLIEWANREGRILLIRDKDFVGRVLRKRVKTGLIYIAVPIRKENYYKLARIIRDNLGKCVKRLMVVYEDYAELVGL